MKCNQCGKERLGEDQTCSNCGVSLGASYNFEEIDFVFDEVLDSASDKMTDSSSEEHQSEQLTKNKHRKLKLFIAGIVILAGIFVVIFTVINQSYTQEETSYVRVSQNSILPFSFMVNGSDTVVLFQLDGDAPQMIKKSPRYLQSLSMSREVVALATGSDHELYVATDQDLISVDFNVETAVVSQDGTGVAYVKNVTNEVGDLYLYDVRSKKSRKVSSEVSLHDYRLSPDGESIAYCKVQKPGLQFDLYVSIDKKESKMIASEEKPVGISNQGTYLYAMGEKGFYLFQDEKMVKLGNDYNEAGTNLMFNRDYSQVLYFEEGKSYLSLEGSIKPLTEGVIFNVVLPLDANFGWNPSGILSFANHIIQKEEGFYYINDQFELIYLDKNLGTGQVAEDQKSFLLIENQEIYKLKDFNHKTITKEKLGDASNVMRFTANHDLSIIYYINHDSELFCMKENGKTIKIADHVADFSLNYYDGLCYYVTEFDEIQEGGLYYTSGQEEGKSVINLERAMFGGMSGGILAADLMENGNMDIYTLINGEAKLIISNVRNQ